jgi:hypothetical protein
MDPSHPTVPAAPKRFKFVPCKTSAASIGNAERDNSATSASAIESDMASYLAELENLPEETVALEYWLAREAKFCTISKLAQDLVSAPASQAYVERIFSVSGDLSARKRNRATVKLERRVFLKVNARILGKINGLK